MNSGTDAITLGLHLLGVKRNDEVITPPNSFIASTAAIVHLGAKPVFADVKYNQNIDPREIEKKYQYKHEGYYASSLIRFTLSNGSNIENFKKIQNTCH